MTKLKLIDGPRFVSFDYGHTWLRMEDAPEPQGLERSATITKVDENAKTIYLSR